jgi:glycosyltransferase involved in cell wall biosynthesis
MRIFYICYEDLSAQVAWTTHIKEVVENLQKLGNELLLFAPKFGKLESDVEFRHIYIPTTNVRLLNECLYYFLLFFYLIAYQIRLRADIFYMREMRLCLPVALVSKLFDIPHIIEVNGALVPERKLIGTSRIKIFLFKFFQRMNFFLCNEIIVVAEFIRDYLKQYYNIADNKIVTIVNGVNTELFKPLDKIIARKELGFKNDLYYITYVGSFYPHHALDYLVRLVPLLLERLDNLRVVFVGEGYAQDEIENLAMKLGLKHHVQFVGKVDYQNVPKFINASDVCVQFGSSPEKIMALKLWEYLSCGVPVVVNWKAFGSTVVIHKEIVTEIDLNEMEDAAEIVIDLLRNEAHRIDMGKRARRFIEENYSWNRTARRILEVCQSLSL